MLRLSLFACLIAASTPAAAQALPDEIVPLTIEEAVEMGLERSFQAQRSVRDSEIADLNYDNVRAGLRPKLDSSIDVGQYQRYTQYRGSVLRFTDLKPNFGASATATARLPIDLWGVTKRRVRQAELTRQSTDLRVQTTQLTIANDIRTRYIAALKAEGKLVADDRYANSLKALIDAARKRQAGVLDFLTSEYEGALQSRQGRESDYQYALSVLEEALRMPEGKDVFLESALPEPPSVPLQSELRALAEEHRADLKRAKIALEKSRISRRQARDFRKPSVGLNAYAAQSLTGRTPLLNDEDRGRSTDLGISLSLSVPLLQYDGGVQKNSERIADIEAEQANADYGEALERADRDIEQILIELDSARRQLALLPDIERAKAILDKAEADLLAANAASAPALLAQVSNARDNWRKAMISEVDTLADHATNLVRLDRAIGIIRD